MPASLRKFIGSLALVAFSIAYFWFAVSIAIVRLPELSVWWHLLFYLVATVIWFVPSAAIVYWIQAPGKSEHTPSR